MCVCVLVSVCACLMLRFSISSVQWVKVTFSRVKHKNKLRKLYKNLNLDIVLLFLITKREIKGKWYMVCVIIMVAYILACHSG